jgi:hypothetical protein
MFDTYNHITEWEVELAISGAITVEERVSDLFVEKGESNPFTTRVTLSRASHGVRCVLKARAYTQENASDAAAYFVGQALDVLSLRFDTPLYLNLFRPEFRQLPDHVRRIVKENEWADAFHFGREYGMNRRVFSRAISWYRKGLVSEDPIDQIIAFWSALEGIGANFHCVTKRNKTGIINQVCDCLQQLWGPPNKWKIIPDNANAINKFHDYRNGFSHGFKPVNVETIREVVADIPQYQKLVHTFLVDWELQGFEIEQNLPRSEQ